MQARQDNGMPPRHHTWIEANAQNRPPIVQFRAERERDLKHAPTRAIVFPLSCSELMSVAIAVASCTSKDGVKGGVKRVVKH